MCTICELFLRIKIFAVMSANSTLNLGKNAAHLHQLFVVFAAINFYKHFFQDKLILIGLIKFKTPYSQDSQAFYDYFATVTTRVWLQYRLHYSTEKFRRHRKGVLLFRKMGPAEVVGIGMDLTPLYLILLKESGYYSTHPDTLLGKSLPLVIHTDPSSSPIGQPDPTWIYHWLVWSLLTVNCHWICRVWQCLLSFNMQSLTMCIVIEYAESDNVYCH